VDNDGKVPGRAATGFESVDAPGREGREPGREGREPGRDGREPGRDGSVPGRAVGTPGREAGRNPVAACGLNIIEDATCDAAKIDEEAESRSR